MANETEIITNALLLLGDKEIVSPTEDSDRARIGAALYPRIRDAVLRAHPWNFAITRQKITAEVTGPVFGEFLNKFKLPTHPFCLRVLSLDDNPEIRFKIEGRFMLSNVSTANYQYIMRVVDPNQFDSDFIGAVEVRLAQRMALAITGGAQVRRDFEDEYRSLLREARSIDAQEGSQDPLSANDLINARFRQGSS